MDPASITDIGSRGVGIVQAGLLATICTINALHRHPTSLTTVDTATTFDLQYCGTDTAPVTVRFESTHSEPANYATLHIALMDRDGVELSNQTLLEALAERCKSAVADKAEKFGWDATRIRITVRSGGLDITVYNRPSQD